jgi:autotransporter-associated beta strand protein
VLTAATNGLMGYYYNVTPNTANFATLAAMESHFATLTPDLAALSGSTSNLFDFGVGTTFTFPAPYNSTGSRPINFETVWRGVLTVPLRGYYTFGVTCDDGFLLALDGQTVMSRTAFVAAQTEGGIRLDAGRYDMVLGYFQATSGGGIKVNVRLPGASGFVALPSAWLAPYSSSGPLTGTGGFSANASNALFRAVQNSGLATFGGDLSGPSGALFSKTGSGQLALTGSGAAANAFAGDLDVQGGTLALKGNERLGDASVLRVRTGASLAVAGTETVGALAGGGSLILGGGSVYALPFDGDADSDISLAKTYTHLLDFPANGNPATINGVLFTAADMSGSSGGYGWSVTAGTAPNMAWNTSPADTTRTGVDRLLWDFQYNSADYTLTLTGLTPGQSYETRLYFRSFTLGATRNVTFSFSTGAAALGSLTHNIDALARTWVGCRYVAGGTSLNIRIVSVVPGTTCHLYGLSNEQVAEPLSPSLTVATAAGRTDSFTGPVAGYGALVKTGAGTQRFAGANTLPSPLEVRTGKVSLDAGATVLSGAVVTAGATLAAPFGNVTLGSLTGSGTFNLTGSGVYTTNTGPYFVTFTNDATTGISPDKTYTHLLDFGTRSSPATVINGVAFDKVIAVNGPLYGYGWTNFPATAHGGNAPPVPAGSGIYNLLYDMNYGMVTGVVRITGLTVGKRYEVRLYNRVWSAGNRSQVFLFDPDGTGPISDSVTFNPDAAGSLPNFLGYRYTAGTNNLAITFQLVVATYAYHLYGLSNEEVYDSQLNPATLDIAGSSVFDGAVTGPGGWAKAGAGKLTLTGTSSATGPLAVNAGVFGVANNGVATAGPVTVAPGATLFGHGLVGGAVTVASNAWLQAGTATSCGTLQIGGSLTLMPGTRLAYRFDTAGGNDTVTVAGLLTFPTNGVVQASPLTVGVNPPAKDVFFSSVLAINGPANLAGWTVEGVKNASLKYSTDHKTIYFSSPRGMLLKIL